MTSSPLREGVKKPNSCGHVRKRGGGSKTYSLTPLTDVIVNFKADYISHIHTYTAFRYNFLVILSLLFIYLLGTV